MAKFNINPTLVNGLTSTYVSKDGSDSTGTGTATNPYLTIYKACSGATAGHNIVIGNGVWEEDRYVGKAFKFWGCGDTIIKKDVKDMIFYGGDRFYYCNIHSGNIIYNNSSTIGFYDCYIKNVYLSGTGGNYAFNLVFERCVISGCYLNPTSYSNIGSIRLINNVFINVTFSAGANTVMLYAYYWKIINNIFYNTTLLTFGNTNSSTFDYNNFTNSSIVTTNGSNPHGLNNSSVTYQTVTDYFNDYLNDDYTAKVGSKNIQAGHGRELSPDIGLSRGYYFDTTNTGVTGGGAILQNLTVVNSALTVLHTDCGVINATSNSITLDNTASASNDYYNGLFIRIIDGAGSGQTREVLDYDGTTKIATVSNWTVIPSPGDIYALSGFFESDVLDLGRVIRVNKSWFISTFQYDYTGEFYKYFSMDQSGGTSGQSFYTCAIKYSGINNLNDKSWKYFQINGKTLSDGTYGDGDDNYNIAAGSSIMFRYFKIKMRFLV